MADQFRPTIPPGGGPVFGFRATKPRTIGRNIEYVFMDYLIKKIKESKRDTITAKYIKSSKNEQVKDFYDRCSFNLVSKNDSEREYVLDRSNYKSSGINYIRLSNE